MSLHANGVAVLGLRPAPGSKPSVPLCCVGLRVKEAALEGRWGVAAAMELEKSAATGSAAGVYIVVLFCTTYLHSTTMYYKYSITVHC